MRKRDFPAIDTVPLVGGALCLDFVNTTGARACSAPRERLLSYADLLVWCRRMGLLTPVGEGELVQKARQDQRLAASTLSYLLRLREAIYRLFRAKLDQRSPETADVQVLNRAIRRSLRRRHLEWNREQARWAWTPPSLELDCMIGPVVDSAVELMMSQRSEALGQCEECDWLFLDSSKNLSRRWCKKTCGDRVKARRYYRRKKATA